MTDAKALLELAERCEDRAKFNTCIDPFGLLKEAAAALRGAAAVPPDGFVLVPLIPTPQMVEVGCENNPTMWNDETDDGFAAMVANDIYVSMVRAAVSRPAPEAPAATPPNGEIPERETWRHLRASRYLSS